MKSLILLFFLSFCGCSIQKEIVHTNAELEYRRDFLYYQKGSNRPFTGTIMVPLITPHHYGHPRETVFCRKQQFVHGKKIVTKESLVNLD